jgi:hypothetical protein
MTYNADRLMNVLSFLMSGVMVLGIVIMVLYTLLYDKRDPEICLKFGGTPVIVDGKPMCDMEK